MEIKYRPRVTIRELTVWLLFALACAVAGWLFAGCEAPEAGGSDAGDVPAALTRGAAPMPDAGTPTVDSGAAGAPDALVAGEAGGAPVPTLDAGTACPAGSAWDAAYRGYDSAALTGCCVISRANERAQVVACW